MTPDHTAGFHALQVTNCWLQKSNLSSEIEALLINKTLHLYSSSAQWSQSNKALIYFGFVDSPSVSVSSFSRKLCLRVTVPLLQKH